MANNVVGNLGDINAAIKLTHTKAGQFQSLGKQVEAAMEALRPHYVGPAATDFQNTISAWHQQLLSGVSAFTEMGNALQQGRNKFQQHDEQHQHQAKNLANQVNNVKSFKGALGSGH